MIGSKYDIATPTGKITHYLQGQLSPQQKILSLNSQVSSEENKIVQPIVYEGIWVSGITFWIKELVWFINFGSNCWVPDGAAEEAGLMVGDYVLAVNGVDVTSIPHSKAANLARQGTPRSADLRIYRSPASFSVKLSLGDKQ